MPHILFRVLHLALLTRNEGKSDREAAIWCDINRYGSFITCPAITMTLPMESADSRANPKNEAVIRFSEQDLTLFCEASGDRNPLHMSAAYASRTAYGQQVVFGALGALVCLGRANLKAGDRIIDLTGDFHRPLFLDVDYQVKISEKHGVQLVRLFDGTVPLVTLSIASKPDRKSEPASKARESLFERTEAAERKSSEISVGTNTAGSYRADPSKLEILRERWSIKADPFPMEALLWGSYLVGMELPGRNGLFFRFALKLEGDPSPGPLAYEATVSRLNRQIGQLRMAVRLSSEGRQVASGHFLSFIRSEVDQVDAMGQHSPLPVAGALEAKVAVIIGGSRGLGAAITAAMAIEGAHIIATSRSEGVDFSALCPPDAAARIVHEIGDAADHNWLCQLRDRVVATHGRVDILVCNAFPAIPALRLEIAALSRLEAYLSRATTLVLAPLCAFLELLNQSSGCAVVISSMAVEHPVREWPHYIAAKRAIEAFATVAPLQYPQTSALIVRPAKLLTEMTNTPMGRQKAAPPRQMAHEIVERLQKPLGPGSTEILPATGVV